MGMFIPEDKFYDETKRQTGFNRYKQLLGRHFADWFKLNALTILGLLPLAAGIGLAIATSSILVLIPCAVVGGMIFGLSCPGCTTVFSGPCGMIPCHGGRIIRKAGNRISLGVSFPAQCLG